MFYLRYTTSLPDNSHHSATTKVAQFPMAVWVGALRNHVDPVRTNSSLAEATQGLEGEVVWKCSSKASLRHGFSGDARMSTS
jgi:hypothetical protein